jgi:predicted permease
MIPIVQDIVSVFFVLAPGYFSGKRSMFTQDQAEGMNHLDCLASSLIVSALLFAAAAPMWIVIARSFSN